MRTSWPSALLPGLLLLAVLAPAATSPPVREEAPVVEMTVVPAGD